MILRTDGPPDRGRYSLGVFGSLVIHVVLAAAVFYVAGTMRPADRADAGAVAGRNMGRHSSALLRAGRYGGDPTGTMGSMPRPAEVSASFPVKQVESLGLRMGIGHVIDHLWQSTLFAIAAGLLTLAFRRNRARVRYALWFAASVKFLVPFSLMVWLGSFITSSALAFLGTSDPLGAAGSLGSPGSPGALDSPPIWLLLLQDLARYLPFSGIGGIGQSLATTGTAALWPSTFTITEVTRAWLILLLLGIWTCGFFAIVAYRIKQSRRLWDVVLTSRRVELLDVKVPKRLQVGLADGLLEPGVLGWMRPVLLLPADIESHLTRPEIEAIVAHELCHVRRFDNMTAAIHMVVEAIFWFHPLVWWLGARLVDERERACDEHVLRTGGAPGPYAQGILNVCKRYVESPLASVSGVGSANVRQRIDAILANRIGEATGTWKKVMLSALIMCVVIVPLAAGAMQAPPAPNEPTESRRDRSPLGEFRFKESVAVMPQREASPLDAASAGTPAVTAYALVVARDDGQLGPELTRSPTSARDAARENSEDNVVVRPGAISADGITLSRLAALVAKVIERDVEDHTGLTGHFTLRLTWASASDARGPSLFTAMQQQLGLRLVPLAASDSRLPPTSR
jgi:beta-lactamase regulating signal transducer with metallopeptidase domain